MYDLSLLNLRLFVQVCEQRSIARVAQAEALVASAISKRLAQLEHQMGAPLFIRERRGLRPTAAGETLLEHARTMLAAANHMQQEMAAYSKGVQGQVRVLVTASVMAESLADHVASFLQQPAHASIRVTLEECVSPDVVRGVREGRAAMGICWDAADLSGLQTQPYGSDHLAIAAHKSHPIARMAQSAAVHFSDVLDYEHVSMPALSAVQILLTRAAAQEGKALRHRVHVSNFDAALRVVQANLAISVVPREVALSFAANTDVRVIPLADSWAQRQFAISYRDAALLSSAAKALLSHLAAQSPQALHTP
ncbi:LysR family transcriptional regulator [Comamonas sp.]|uniref:LysR family transcriptional regulator n=1 Tax=Comamonas sp. TaxID=34028 RepID=UPI00289A06B9|nr:LysR family transcriptional regulator [Comamonas sp.]